jgi:ribosomal small subunit protein bTHX
MPGKAAYYTLHMRLISAALREDNTAPDTKGITMGRGDKRSFRGKIFKGSHGNTRLRKAKQKKKAPAKKS